MEQGLWFPLVLWPLAFVLWVLPTSWVRLEPHTQLCHQGGAHALTQPVRARKVGTGSQMGRWGCCWAAFRAPLSPQVPTGRCPMGVSLGARSPSTHRRGSLSPRSPWTGRSRSSMC